MRILPRLFLAAALLPGCAVAFQDRPSRHAATERCSPSKLWIADAVLMVGSVGAAVAGQFIGGDGGNTMTGVSLLGGVVELASMNNGRKWSSACQRGPDAPWTVRR